MADEFKPVPLEELRSRGQSRITALRRNRVLLTGLGVFVGGVVLYALYRKISLSKFYGRSSTYRGDAGSSPTSAPTALRGTLDKYFVPNLTKSQSDAFYLALPSTNAQALHPYFVSVGRKYGVNPFLLAAIAERESNYGAALDATLRGDSGHGHGIMQIDDRTWGSWINMNAWADPEVNISKAAEILVEELQAIRSRYPNLAPEYLASAVIGAYNAGRTRILRAVANGADVDNYTTDNYVAGDRGVKANLNRLLNRARIGVGAS